MSPNKSPQRSNPPGEAHRLADTLALHAISDYDAEKSSQAHLVEVSVKSISRGGQQIKNSYTSLMRRFAKVGFKQDFARSALLPDWWVDDCEKDQSLLPDLELRIARFLATEISVVRDPAKKLVVPAYPGAQLRRVGNMDRDKLAPAIHTAMQVATALVRTLDASLPRVKLPPADGLSWRQQMKHKGSAVTLDDILDDLWNRGIPVVSLDELPPPRFQGMACIVANRPVIMVGYKHDEPSRVAFWTAHEACHIAAGHCTPDHPVVDEEEDVSDNADIERTAEKYATHVLAGADEIPKVEADSFRDLANKAIQNEQNTGADAVTIILAWARRTNDYTTASLAAKALYRATGARRILKEHVKRHVNMEAASENDRILLRCVVGGADSDAIDC